MTSFLGSRAVETALGTSFVYLLIAAFCSTLNEWISALLQVRAGMLAAAIHELLNRQNTAEGTEFVAAFYAHPVITAMMDHHRHPSYLPSRSFVTAVLDLATPRIHGPFSFADLTVSLAALPEGDVRTSLQSLIQNAQGDLTHAEVNIENWYNDAMSRASRSYKQRTALWTALIAAVLTIALNADSIAMLRGAGAIGWDVATQSLSHSAWVTRITGWGITIAAVSLGAPFWFAVLKRMVYPREG